MRDGLVTLPSLGQTAGRQCYRRFKSLNICLPIYDTTVSRRSQEPMCMIFDGFQIVTVINLV